MTFSNSGAGDPMPGTRAARTVVVLPRLPIDQGATIGDILDALEAQGFAFFARIRGVKLETCCPDCNRGGPVRRAELYRSEQGALVLELEP